MSIIKSIKQVLGLGPAAENHFWDGSVANQLILKRGTPDAPGVELIKASNGVLSFPNQGQSLTTNGYVNLPGGLIVQWGEVTKTGDTAQPVSFPIPFTQILALTLGLNDPNSSTTLVSTTSATNIGFNVLAYNNSGSSRVYWIALGR
jgi:hypothetical protein